MKVVQENTNNINGVHILETPEDIIINSQIYDKNTFEPKPLNFFNLDLVTDNGFSQKNILTYYKSNIERFGASTGSHAIVKEPNYTCFIQDNQDQNIVYYLDYTKAGFFTKVQKTEKGFYKKINSISPISGYYKKAEDTRYGGWTNYEQKILGQTNDYVILYQEAYFCPNNNVSVYHSGGAYSSGVTTWGVSSDGELAASYVFINKSTLAVTYINVANQIPCCTAGVYIISSNKDYIYVFERLNTATNIVKLDPLNLKRTVLYNSTAFLNLNCNVLKYKDYYYTILRTSDTTYPFKLKCFNINYNNDTVSSPNIPGYDTSEINLENISATHQFVLWSLKIINDSFISITTYENNQDHHTYRSEYWFWQGRTVTTDTYTDKYVASNAGQHRYRIFKLNSDRKIYELHDTKYETEKQFIYGVLNYDSYTDIVLINDRIVVYRLNKDTEENIKVFESIGSYRTIGLDQNHNLYIFDTSNKCTIHNNSSSKSLSISFEATAYTYNGDNIETYINIGSKNFLDEYIKTKVKITIDGNCVFQENNSKELITYTDYNNIKEIPVTITAGGVIYCYIKEVK